MHSQELGNIPLLHPSPMYTQPYVRKYPTLSWPHVPQPSVDKYHNLCISHVPSATFQEIYTVSWPNYTPREIHGNRCLLPPNTLCQVSENIPLYVRPTYPKPSDGKYLAVTQPYLPSAKCRGNIPLYPSHHTPAKCWEIFHFLPLMSHLVNETAV